MTKLMAAVAATVALTASACSGGEGDEAGTTKHAAEGSAAPAAASALPPADFAAEPGSFAVVLRWTPPAELPDGYALFRDGVELGTLLGTATTFKDDDGVVPNRRYLYEIEAREGTSISERVSVNAKTEEPPLRAARVQGTFNARARNVSVSGFEDFDVPTYGWRFRPLCKEGACDVRFGDLHQKRVRTKLNRAGDRYRGTYTGHFGVACESTSAPSTVTITLEVAAARALAGEWRATRLEGTLVIAQPAQLGCMSGRVEQKVNARFLR